MSGRHEPVLTAFALIHVAVGVYLAAQTLAGFLNTTTISVGRGELSVVTEPIRFLVAKNVRLAAADVDQLYCEMYTHNTKNSGVTYSYSLNAIDRQGKTQILVKSLETVGEALWLEHELEKALQIIDRPVAGEVRQKVA